MADKIRITPSELKDQATKLQAIGSQTDDVAKKTRTAINLLNNALSAKFAFSMKAKGSMLVSQLIVLTEKMLLGSKTANQCAESYENADTVLRKLMENSLPDEVLSAPASSQQVMTEFDAKVQDLQQKEGFKDGQYWGYSNTYVGNYNGQYIGGSQCFAMAHMMQVEVMGKRGYSIGSTNFDDIQVGDAINYAGPGTDSTWGHWVFVIGKEGDKLIVAEGNWNEQVNWGREISKDEISIWQIDRAS